MTGRHWREARAIRAGARGMNTTTLREYVTRLAGQAARARAGDADDLRQLSVLAAELARRLETRD